MIKRGQGNTGQHRNCEFPPSAPEGKVLKTEVFSRFQAKTLFAYSLHFFPAAAAGISHIKVLDKSHTTAGLQMQDIEDVGTWGAVAAHHRTAKEEALDIPCFALGFRPVKQVDKKLFICPRRYN